MLTRSPAQCEFLGKACRPIATVVGLVVVLVSQWAKAAESTQQRSSAAPTKTTAAVMDASAAETPFWARSDRYHLAFGARASAGSANFDTELGTMVEGFARYQAIQGLGITASFLHLDVGNNESYENFKADALTIGPTWHPLKGYWIDPFVEARLVGLVGIDGGQRFGYADANGTFHAREPSRIGAEGILGLELASRYFAGGLHARLGSTDHRWFMLGAQVEARL